MLHKTFVNVKFSIDKVSPAIAIPGFHGVDF